MDNIITLMDKALTELSTSKKVYLNHDQIKEYIFRNSSDIDVEAIIARLKKDDFIHNGGEANPIVYKISVDGEIFLAQGGYQGEIDSKIAENNRILTIEANQKKNQSLMTLLTAVVAVGTTVAAIYYAIEIWKFFTAH